MCQALVLTNVLRVAFVSGWGLESCLHARLWCVADSGVPGWGPDGGSRTTLLARLGS